MGILTLESLTDSFSDMHTDFQTSSIACSYALPFFLRQFHGWNLLENPTHGLGLVSWWKSLLHADTYTQLIMEAVFSAVRVSGTNIWRESDREPMLQFVEFLDSWETLLPPAVVQFISDSIILANLSAAVESWEPRTGTESIHKWVHPWLPRLHNKLGPCYQTIWQKLGRFLCNKLDPVRDRSVYEQLVEPWKPVFDAASWDKLMVESTAPKLSNLMLGFQINPNDHENNIDDFRSIMIWAANIPYRHQIQMMKVFFAKWLRVLHHWLNSPAPDFNQVSTWYSSWRNEVGGYEVSDYELVRSRIRDGIIMMNRAAEGRRAVLPEHVSDDQKVEEAGRFEKAARFVRQGGEEEGDGGDREMSLKQVVEAYADLNGVLLQPKRDRMHYGHQVYGFGDVSIVIDSHNQILSALMDGEWKLVNLVQLKESAVLRKHRLSPMGV